MPESVLREELARLKAQLAESRAEIDRERRIRSEAELEKEHFRAQMHRVALALKRERDKSATVARQELEQLRLEFLAREERYVLDGDRDELRTIRYELAKLRTQHQSIEPQGRSPPDRAFASNVESNSAADMELCTDLKSTKFRLRNALSYLLSAGYDESDEAVKALRATLNGELEL